MKLKNIRLFFNKKVCIEYLIILRLDYYSFSDNDDWLHVDNIRINKAREEKWKE